MFLLLLVFQYYSGCFVLFLVKNFLFWNILEYLLMSQIICLKE